MFGQKSKVRVTGSKSAKKVATRQPCGAVSLRCDATQRDALYRVPNLLLYLYLRHDYIYRKTALSLTVYRTSESSLSLYLSRFIPLMLKPGFHPNAIACVACVACVAFGWKPG